MSGPLRVGMAGAGWVTQHHLAGWKAQGEAARVVAIADPDAAAAGARAVQYGIAQVFGSVEAMLAGCELDAVDVAAPREFHAPIVRLAARRGHAVLCQKPLAPTLAEARMLAAEAAPLCRLMVHENWRFRPYYRDLRGWLAAGRIGEVVQAQMTLLTSGLVQDANGALPALVRQPFVATLERALVTEILIHHLDTLRFLLGELTLRYARLGHGSAAMRGEDRAFIAMDTAQGAPVAVMANLAVHGRAPTLADRLTIVGTRGTIELEGDTLRCLGEQPAQLTYDMPACYSQSYGSAIGHFVECLRTGADFETSAAENLRTLELVEAIYERG